MKTRFSKSRLPASPLLASGDPPRNGALIHLQKILVPVDFLSESTKAITYAVAFAREFDARITLLHVVEPIVCPADFGYGPVTMQIPDHAMLRKAKARLDRLGKRLVAGKFLAETLALSGKAYFEITEAAKALGSDLIVIGTHGRTGLEHTVLGSTAEKVVRHAPCPVFVVRRKEHEFIC
jgi:nucleotide-binding universal stress UspA family protein